MLNVYIAAPFPLKCEAVALKAVLEGLGHSVTSTWLRIDDMPDTDAAARLDLSDVARADVLLALNPFGWEVKGTGGRHAELGAALILDKPVVLLGVRSNVFHHHSNVEVAAHRAEALTILTRIWAGRQVART